MKIVITGTTGRLGKTLQSELSDAFEVIGLSRAGMNLSAEASIRQALEPLEYDVLINPAAITNVDYAEDNPDEAMQVNCRAPELMAEISRAKNARMIHVSTDYVFDGEDKSMRLESDQPRPLNAYGRSKHAGENAVLGVSDGFLVIRTSWIFGPSGPSFVDSILDRARTQAGVTAVEDKFSTPTYAIDFAKYVRPLLNGPHATGGILHLCNSGRCSWREYGQAAIDAALDARLSFATERLGGLSVTEMPGFVGSRPIHTSMSVDKFAALTGITPRPWQEAVSDYISDHYVPRIREND